MPKKYLTPVFDIIITENDEVKILETGMGLFGSGTYDFDFSHSQNLRQLMVQSLASKVNKLFIVSPNQEPILVNYLGHDFLATLHNVTLFSSLTEFIDFAKTPQSQCDNSLVIVDCISRTVKINETNYANILKSHGFTNK